MAIHHIIPKHEWKKRFGNLKGVNSADNLSPELYSEQHAQVHSHYYNEITHLEYDRIAGLTIAKQIGKEEAHRLAASIANIGNKHCVGKKNGLGSHWTPTDEFKKAASVRMKGTKHSLGHQNALGHNVTDETRRKRSEFMKGKKIALGYKHTDDWKTRASERMSIPQVIVKCSYCEKSGGSRGMKRYHFSNCQVH